MTTAADNSNDSWKHSWPWLTHNDASWLSHYVTETSHLYSLRDLWRHFGLCRAAAHSDCCFFCAAYKYSYLLTLLIRVLDILLLTYLPVAPEAVWQVERPPFQSEIWYGGAIQIRWNLGSWFSEKFIEIVTTRCQILRLKCTKIDFG